METEKKQHGGARANAGRKKLDNARIIKVGLSLSKKAFETLERLATEQKTTKNDIINQLLESM